MRAGPIRIRGARQNNLRGVDLDLPRGRLIAITGVSGSGKSSLAFDTLFREGQRRFLETLSAYARQFLGRMEKPDVESVEGLSPAIAVDQKAAARSARSTVGTLTEIYDHLRVLFARAGIAHCRACRLPLRAQTVEGIVQQVQAHATGEKVMVLAPLVRDRKGYHRSVFADLARGGFVRARVDGEILRIEDAPELERYKRHTIEAVVDRLKLGPDRTSRLRESLQQAVELSGGDVIIQSEEGERTFSTQRTCPGCGAESPPLEPRLFSFNSPHGACPSCEGLGTRHSPSLARVVADPAKSIREGALGVTRRRGGALLYPNVDFRFLDGVAEAHGFDLDTPWRDLREEDRRIVLHGTGDERFRDKASWNGTRFQGSYTWNRRFRGVIPTLERAAKKGRKHARSFLALERCSACDGSRLRAEAAAVRLGGVGIVDLVRLSVRDLQPTLDGLSLDSREARIARDLLAEIRRRVAFLEEVGLEYLTLERAADTLSGGEAQRIRLAAQLGAGLQGVLYVLDEPSIGLHHRDQGRLLVALGKLRDGGNTVVVVEHDEATLRAADYVIDVGPGAGRHGGEIAAAGTPSEIEEADSPTARFLRGELDFPAPDVRRPGNGNMVRILGARAFNLRGIDVSLPLGTLTVVTGVSGSGKSTLVDRILLRAAKIHLGRESEDPLDCDGVEGLEHVEELVCIDARPIGRTPRSNPATYTGALGPIRDLFSSLPEARVRGYTKSRFSFNLAGGRCESCGGAGAKLVELQFLAPVTVPCEDCGGRRFQDETLEVHYKGHSIADVLDLTVEEALELFKDHPKIARPLATLQEIGVGYLKLGQPSTTLSGGEAQRIKLATHLQRRSRKHTLYLLDEPTTGLHALDVRRLVTALQKLVDAGHSVLIIEHHLDLIRAADHCIDLGPEGGSEGGQLVAQGTPEALQEVSGSYTGQALAAGACHPESGPVKSSRELFEEDRGFGSDAIDVRGAHTHNLQGIDVRLPRDALTVVTGPSGSGKSSLALDTIHAEGRRRFVESLSTYARQFLGTGDRPPVERIDGLGPSVAVEAGTSRGHPRSIVATTTEIHDYLRVLFSRGGEARCPEHGEKLLFQDAGTVARRMVKELAGAKGWIVAPIRGEGRTAKVLAGCAEDWRRAGFLRLLVDGVEHRLDEKLPRTNKKTVIDLVVDRLAFEGSTRTRIAEAVEQAEAISGGHVSAIVAKARGATGKRLEFSTRGACPTCGFSLARRLEPRDFSFNTHAGACESCDGLGERLSCDASLLVSRPERSLVDGAVGGKFGRYLTKGKGYYEHLLRRVAAAHRVNLSRPFEELSQRHKDLLLLGRGARREYEVRVEKNTANAELSERFSASWPGLCGHVDGWYRRAEDPEWISILESVMSRKPCPDCEGERLRPEVRAVTVGRRRLPQVLGDSVDEALRWAHKVRMPAAARKAVGPVLEEIQARLGLLQRVGLGYLTLDRHTSTLSGGEARRVRLSASLGSKLVGVCYVLDEPTVGLHPADVSRLTDALLELRQEGNTVLVVEHDEYLMERADHIVDLGPGAGREGGRVVASGTPAEVRASDSATGAALRGELRPVRTAKPAPHVDEMVSLHGAKLHNLKGVELAVKFGRITGVCGPSGSGKSTLILDTLVPAMKGERPEGRWSRLRGPRGMRVVEVNANPIGRTPKSVPATYTGLLEPLRELFARTPDARMRGFGPAHFSFNSARGRCPACEGRGANSIEMLFLADLWLTCEECEGRRYAQEVLEVRYRGKSIADVLAMSVAEACEFLEHQPKCAGILKTLREVGLGYMPLDQSSTTLSGGEAQRVKLSGELLSAESDQPTVLVLDEPTTGLHASDVTHLVRVLDNLAARGHAVIVIEHHTGVLSTCDHLVELGPAGGADGGRVIAEGSPRELASDSSSITGPYLHVADDGVKKGRARKPGRGGRRGDSKSRKARVAG